MAERKVKYMGTSDVHTLEKGEDWDGRLAEGLKSDLVFDKSNKWTVDVSDLSDDAVELLLEDKASFKDVTGLARIPSNAHQQMFLGHKATAEANDENQNPSGSSGADAGGGTTVGGSTRGGGRRGGGTTVGGSGSD